MAHSGGHHTAHLQIRSQTPALASLPNTETGYRSHFINPDDIDAEGGPVAKSRGRFAGVGKRQDASRQMSLF